MANRLRNRELPAKYLPARAVLAGVAAIALMAQAPPSSGPPSISPSDPLDVADHSGFPGLPIDFFDDFSWQMFLTMVWPADPAARGQPDRTRTLDAPGPRVFETFRTTWEAFQPGGARPPTFEDDAPVTPCPNTPLPPHAFVIGAFPNFEEMRQADAGFLSGPLAAQNGTWTRYMTGYNRIQYDHILNNRLYVHAEGRRPTSPTLSVVVKSAWVEMRDMPEAQQNRYYRRMAWVMDPALGPDICVERMVGLVGLHIVKKTPSRPQWIWATFEHIDTVPDGGPARPLAYNDGTDRPMDEVNPLEHATPVVPRPLPNVIRVWPIATAVGNTRGTVDTNRRYRAALAAQGSVWQNYQLVMTQWPNQPNAPSVDGLPAHTTPGTNARTSFANTTMETFAQAEIGTGCMSCHNRAVRGTGDFIWAVSLHAFRPNQNFSARGNLENAPEVRELRALMRSAQRANRRVLRNRQAPRN